MGKLTLEPLDAHLHGVRIVLRGEQDVDEDHEPPLLNFDKWTHLKEMAMDPLRYRDAHLKKKSIETLRGSNIKSSGDELRRAMGYLHRVLPGDIVDGHCSSLLQMEASTPKGGKQQMKRAAAVRAVGFG